MAQSYAPPVRLVAVGTEPVGVIALGANATGVVAVGQLATGVVAVGQLSRGVFAVGQLSIGIVAFGQLALGVGWCGGMLGIGGHRRFGLLVYGVLDRPTARAARIIGVVVLALLWWLGVGQWLWHDIVREGGIFVDQPRVLR